MYYTLFFLISENYELQKSVHNSETSNIVQEGMEHITRGIYTRVYINVAMGLWVAR